MKGRITIAILVLTLLMSSVFAGAMSFTKNDDNSTSATSMYGYHKITLYPPWGDNNHFTNPMEGDVEVDADSTNVDGNALVKCQFGWWGTEQGEAGFDHSLEWTSPITTDSAIVEFNYYYYAHAKATSFALGDSAILWIWLRFYVDDTSQDITIVNQPLYDAFDYDCTWEYYATPYMIMPLEKGKTYSIRVEAHAYAKAAMTIGSDILSQVEISHQKKDSYVRIRWEDRAPATPSKPSGPTSVNVWRHPDGVTCTYSVTPVTDPDNEDVEYQWYFSDRAYYTEWSKSTSVQYTWRREVQGDFEVKVKARGTEDLFEGFPAESEWSQPLIVTVYFKLSRDVSNPLVLRIFERFSDLSILFERLLQNLR
jgi:hypothetical protein